MTTPRTTQSPALSVRCLFCGWERTGPPRAMLPAQREHRQVHVPTKEGAR